MVTDERVLAQQGAMLMALVDCGRYRVTISQLRHHLGMRDEAHSYTKILALLTALEEKGLVEKFTGTWDLTPVGEALATGVE